MAGHGGILAVSAPRGLLQRWIIQVSLQIRYDGYTRAVVSHVSHLPSEFNYPIFYDKY